MTLVHRFTASLLVALMAFAVSPTQGWTPAPAWAQARAQQSPESSPVSRKASSEASRPDEGGELFDQAHRKRIYEAKKLSYGTAAAWSLAFPGLGNIYTEQYLFAGLAIISMVFAGFFFGYGLWSSQSDLLWTGVGIAGVSYGWSLGTALLGVRATNAELRESLHVDEATNEPGATAGRGFVFTYHW